MSALGSVDQLKSIAIEERPVWRLHWSAFSSQRGCVWQLTRFFGRKWKSGLNRIGHPDWVKLSVELNFSLLYKVLTNKVCKDVWVKLIYVVCMWGIRLKIKGEGQGCVAVWYLTPYFGYFILPPRWLVDVRPCPRKSQKNYTEEKTATDKRRRRFFYTFFYLLGSTTIPWMREFFSEYIEMVESPS